MAKVDDFLIIREYDSLSREANSLKTQMDEELTRLKRREGDLADRQALLKTREADMRSLNDQIAELDRRLAQRLSPEMAAKVEEEGLAMLIRQQELEVEIEEHKTFLAGFSKTVKDIREEIELNLSNQKMKRIKKSQLKIQLMVSSPVLMDSNVSSAEGPFPRSLSRKSIPNSNLRPAQVVEGSFFPTRRLPAKALRVYKARTEKRGSSSGGNPGRKVRTPQSIVAGNARPS
jgi:hypothetical protein